jgi:DNA invertase Pin-like site-specific DNA recombinase
MDAKAVGYVRVRVVPSIPATEDDMISAQVRAITAECERRAWVLDDVFVDRGASANDPERPNLKAALDLLDRGDHVALVVHNMDRLVRRPDLLEAIVARAAGKGWHLVTVT